MGESGADSQEVRLYFCYECVFLSGYYKNNLGNAEFELLPTKPR